MYEQVLGEEVLRLTTTTTMMTTTTAVRLRQATLLAEAVRPKITQVSPLVLVSAASGIWNSFQPSIREIPGYTGLLIGD